MLRWAVICLIIAMIAALFGFGDIAESATDIALVLFYIFLALFAISLIVAALQSRKI